MHPDRAPVAPWHELTREAQLLLKDELDRLLAAAPAQENARVGWNFAMRHPEVIPYMVVQLRQRLAVSPVRPDLDPGVSP